MKHERPQFVLALASIFLCSLTGCVAGANSILPGSTGAGSTGTGSGSSSGSGSNSGSGSSSSPGSGSNSGSGSSASGSTAIALTSLTGINTAACPASGALPAQCQNAFPGQIDTRADVATPNYDVPTGNVSDEDPHTYLNQGASTLIYGNMMLGYCTLAGSTYCNNNVQTGYTSNNAATVAAQAQDMQNRHFDGAIMTWEGPGTSEDAATLLFQSYVNANDCSGGTCSLGYLIMDDGPSWAYNVASTGIPGTSGQSCSNLAGAAFESCVVAHLENDMCYMNGKHWGNSAYLKANGRPVVQVFPDEEVIPSTGPAPSWADVWTQVGEWNEDLPDNCAIAPYNANNGVPLVVFENDFGFQHADSSGSFYWIEPSQTTLVADQFTLNIAGPEIGGTLDNFLATALSYNGAQVWSGAFKGFNSIQSTWGTGRIMDQECGQTWIASLTESNDFFTNPGVPYIQVATWNDYNEGTEIETGINNCFTVSGSVSGGTLSWALNASGSYASIATVSHIEIYDSPDGENLTLLTSQPAALSGSWSLTSLQSGTHTLFVRMVGKNSILNQISTGITYSN